jgi:hypothetical protein
MDGTSPHLVHFDHLREDAVYAQSIETPRGVMLSSHAVKRFFGSFWWPRIYLFRRLLQKLLLWWLRIEKQKAFLLGLDVMVMDNDDALKRHGLRPTYKRAKGFAPLQLSSGRFVIDSVFRSGDKHSNHSDTVQKMVGHVVRQLRRHYRKDVPILAVTADFSIRSSSSASKSLGSATSVPGSSMKTSRPIRVLSARMGREGTRRRERSGSGSSLQTNGESGSDYAG